MTHREAKFRILVIDDDKGRLDSIVERLGPDRSPARSPGTCELIPFDALETESLFAPEVVAKRPGDPPGGVAATEVLRRLIGAVETQLRQNMYHRVYIDFQLDKAGGDRFFGTDLLPQIKRLRPVARRLLVTAQMDNLTPPMIERFPAAFLATGEKAGSAHGYVPGTANDIVEDVVAHYVEWRRRPISINGLLDDDVKIGDEFYSHAFDTVLDHVSRRSWMPADVDVTSAELWHLLRDLFSPAAEDDGVGDASEADQLEDDIVDVHVRAFDSGRSSSTVLECSTFTKRKHQGNTCVVKVGPVGEVNKELARYERYVKFYRTTQRRVEVLGSTRGDTLGAICYSFAGGSNAPAVTLEDLLEARDLRALDCLAQNYSAKSREWFKHVLSGESLLSFFQKIHFRGVDEKPTVLLGLLRDTLYKSNLKELADRLPQFANISATDIRYQNCVVHGDMNSGNMMVAELPGTRVSFDDGATVEAWLEDRKGSLEDDRAWSDGQRRVAATSSKAAVRAPIVSRSTTTPALPPGPKAILIDYRHTRRGPAFMDFAALECSLRSMPECVDGRSVEQIGTDYDREIRLWQLAWGDGPYNVCGRADWRKLDFWGVASYELMKLARRNFEDTQDHPEDIVAGRDRLPTSDWERQYASTCILYALRLLKYDDFGVIKVRPMPTSADPRPKRMDKDLRSQARVRFAAWLAALNHFVANPCGGRPNTTMP